MTNEELFQMSINDDLEDGECMQWTLKKHGPPGHRMVEWPYCQKYMDEEWFEDECYLDITDKYDDCAYWIPEDRLEEFRAKCSS